MSCGFSDMAFRHSRFPKTHLLRDSNSLNQNGAFFRPFRVSQNDSDRCFFVDFLDVLWFDGDAFQLLGDVVVKILVGPAETRILRPISEEISNP